MIWGDLREALLGGALIEPGRGASGAMPSAAVTGIAYDSRAVVPGQIFVALKGVQADGTAFVRQAVERGAIAVVSEHPAPAKSASHGSRSPTRVWRSRFSGGVLYRHPSVRCG